MLIDQLRQYQGKHDLTDTAMAAQVGVSRAMWRRVMDGDVQPGRLFLQGVMLGLPEFTLEVMQFLRNAGRQEADETSDLGAAS